MLLLFLKDRITPLSPNKCNIGWLGWIFPKHAPLRCLPVCQSLKLMRRQQLFVVVVTKDSPCLVRSDKLPSHLSVRENSFQGWKQSPFPPRIMEQKHQPIQLQNKAPRHQKAVSLRITFTSTQTNPKASLLAQTATGVRIFWFFSPTSKTQWHCLCSNKILSYRSNRVTHFPGVTPGHLNSGVQGRGGRAVEDESVTSQQSDGARRAYSDICDCVGCKHSKVTFKKKNRRFMNWIKPGALRLLEDHLLCRSVR